MTTLLEIKVVLDKRLASGEISIDEYIKIMETVSGQASPSVGDDPISPPSQPKSYTSPPNSSKSSTTAFIKPDGSTKPFLYGIAFRLKKLPTIVQWLLFIPISLIIPIPVFVLIKFLSIAVGSPSVYYYIFPLVFGGLVTYQLFLYAPKWKKLWPSIAVVLSLGMIVVSHYEVQYRLDDFSGYGYSFGVIEYFKMMKIMFIIMSLSGVVGWISGYSTTKSWK